tara:strand:+ start:6091 stop:6891 length:801 start_codon:yes stop_codon:yes gene_type:complete
MTNDNFLNPKIIEDFLKPDIKQSIPCIQVFSEVGSTNDIMINERTLYPNGHTCFAERQNHGRGVSGKKWIAVENGIYLSTSWTFEENINSLPVLNQILGINLITTLIDYGFEGLSIQWPNDIVCSQKKLGGILIESKFTADKEMYVVVGIGINLTLSDKNKKTIDRKSTSLYEVNNNVTLDNNKLCARTLESIIHSLQSFENHNYKNIVKEWKNYDPTFNKNIQIHYNGEDIEIVNKGIDLDGSLIGEYNNSSKTFKYNEAKIIKK